MKSLFLLLLFSCSQTRPLISEKPPEWAHSPQSKCNRQVEICAVGTGADFESADAASKAGLAAYFRTEIRSKLKTHSFMDNKSYESVSTKSLESLVDRTLEGSYIFQRFTAKNRVYALAKVDKAFLTKKVRSQIKSIYENMQKKLELPLRLSYISLLEDYESLKPLYLEYLVINGRDYPADINLKDITKFKNSAPKEVVYVEPNGDGEKNKRYEDVLTSFLTKVGHDVVRDKSKATIVVNYDLKREKMYFNVDGFQKWNFLLSFESFRGDEILGKLVLDKVITGRTDRACADQFQEYLDDQLKHKLQDLKI